MNVTWMTGSLTLLYKKLQILRDRKHQILRDRKHPIDRPPPYKKKKKKDAEVTKHADRTVQQLLEET